MAELQIRLERAPAIGDVRQLGTGDTVVLVHGVTKRPDYGRYSDAVRHAIDQGAHVRWER